MGLKLKKSESPIQDMGYLEISYIGRDEKTGKLCQSGDMSWYIECRPDTASLDINVLRANAYNMIIDYYNDHHDDEKPFIIIQDNNIPLEIVAPELSAEERVFLSELYPDLEVIYVLKTAAYMKVPEDKLTESYHKKQDQIEHDIEFICHYVSCDGNVDERVPVKMKDPDGKEIDGISWHIGFDGYFYYKLHSGDLSSLGMNGERMIEIFKRCKGCDIDSVASLVHDSYLKLKAINESRVEKLMSGQKM